MSLCFKKFKLFFSVLKEIQTDTNCIQKVYLTMLLLVYESCIGCIMYILQKLGCHPAPKQMKWVLRWFKFIDRFRSITNLEIWYFSHFNFVISVVIFSLYAINSSVVSLLFSFSDIEFVLFLMYLPIWINNICCSKK